MRPSIDNPNAESAVDAPPEEPSRSQRRREALDVLKLAQNLAAMSDAQLRSIPMPEDLLDEVRIARGVRQQIAHKRQVQYLAKQMRKLDESAIDGIRAAIEHDRDLARRGTADLHRIEGWRDRLIADGDDALGDLLAQFPLADRQRLRRLARSARAERDGNQPLHAFHELFRTLRALIGGISGGS